MMNLLVQAVHAILMDRQSGQYSRSAERLTLTVIAKLQVIRIYNLGEQLLTDVNALAKRTPLDTKRSMCGVLMAWLPKAEASNPASSATIRRTDLASTPPKITKTSRIKNSETVMPNANG